MSTIVLGLLLLNGVISFAIAARGEHSTIWPVLAMTFMYYVGISTTGVLFSAIMRIAKSEWGKRFARLGEIMTLSFIPVTVITLLIIYFAGTDHLFYWASSHGASDGEHHLSPWLGKGKFIMRYIILMPLFYITSYLYFSAGREEEKLKTVPVELEKKLNLLAGFVMFSYVLLNTNIAWDFGMMIIKHWESTIFPPYYWVGNLFAGSAFLFLLGRKYVNTTGKEIETEHLSQMATLLMGFTLLWVYMHWSQHIVIWYSDLPNLTKALLMREGRDLNGNFNNFITTYVIMMMALFVIPFFALMQRTIKLSITALSGIAFIICIGMLINRYLMIIPEFSDGSHSVVLNWSGISVILAGLAAVMLSINAFQKMFPEVRIVTDLHSGHGSH